MLWTDVPVHVIDFEGSTRTGVVEYGVVTLQGGAFADVRTRTCRPRRRQAADEVAVHGLTDESLAGREPFSADWALFAGLRETGVLAAHFSATEHALLRSEWSVPRLSPDFLGGGGRQVAEWGPWIDTGRIAAESLGRGASLALEDLVGALGLAGPLQEAASRLCPEDRCRYHCALYDALAAALVLVALASDQGGEAWSLARVLTASTADPRRRDERAQGWLF